MRKFSFDRRLWENFSWSLVLSALGLIVIGLINLYSVTLNDQPGALFTEFSKQSIFFGGGLLICFLLMFLDYSFLKKYAFYLYLLGLGLLILVEFLGVRAGGATRWLQFWFFRFQPSEFIKPILVIVLAAYFSREEYQNQGLTLKTIILPLIFVGIPFALILKQPDLGTAGLLALTTLPLFLFLKISKRLIFSIIGIFLAFAIWLAAFDGLGFLEKKGILHSYQIERILTHKKPEEDSNGKGWQIIQSKSAIGSGKILGRGFHDGTQQKYGFLPAPKTDFAFAALAEEWGFLGTMVVLALFLSLLLSALGIVRKSKDLFGKYLTLGLTSIIFWQMFINIMMVTGLFPVVGIPLPFVSYGGTSLLATMFSIAVICNVGAWRYQFQDEPIRQNPKVWEEGQFYTIKDRVSQVRRLTPPNAEEPDVFPEYRLPHTKPWLKYIPRRAEVVYPPNPKRE
ncbi:MAG: rod shape-determining protein RodA [Deltaproteobacteria bacterium]|jgi:rod shape determining protein RodA|nr:rod shape-determining protein RodA [Deltaproteobacteria bacterium]